jgi:serine phosphatase RsbU (regulator of sigma subunit)
LPGEPAQLGMVIADVSDKGVPAALFMALSRTVIRTTALSNHSPSAALTQANELILKDSRSDLFLTTFYAALDTHSGRLTFANAGHNRPLWLRAATGECQELVARGIVLGVFEEVELEECQIEIAPGDLLIFFTDGVTEAMDADFQEFGKERLREVVAANWEASVQQVLQVVVEAVKAFTGDSPQSDDLTLFVVKRCPLPA